MDKTAQSPKRRIRDKIREKTNFGGIAAENLFDPDFKRVMESLRAKDDTIRSIAAGEVIGDGNPGADEISLKQLVKNIKSNINRREYMSSLADLNRFHKKVYEIVREIDSLENDVDKVHNDFLFKDLDDDHRKYLHDMKTRFASRKTNLVKEAGIGSYMMDLFHNVGTTRGKALAAWEKRYPGKFKNFKRAIIALSDKTESFFSSIISILKDMGTQRATRHVDNYIKEAGKIVKGYNSYDEAFKNFYKEHVKGFIDKVDLGPKVKEDKISETQDDPELNAPVSALPFSDMPTNRSIPDGPAHIERLDRQVDSLVLPTLDEPSAAPSAAPSTNKGEPLPQAMSPYGPVTERMPHAITMPSAPDANTMPSAPDTISMPQAEMPLGPDEGEYKSDQIAKEMFGKAAHYNFFKTLESLSGESPLIMASFITKYAKSLQKTDPVTAIKLFKIAKDIKV